MKSIYFRLYTSLLGLDDQDEFQRVKTLTTTSDLRVSYLLELMEIQFAPMASYYVNGKLVECDYNLNTGDTVEIIAY